MIIVDFKYESVKQENESTSQFKTADDVVRFAADMSLKHTHFRIERINEYKEGRLIPMEITVEKGRITLETMAVQMPFIPAPPNSFLD